MRINEDFLFLKELNHDLFRRYQLIEEALRNRNGTVYVQMQVFLEHLFKYINRREGYNLVQTTLGDFLKNNTITNYCLLKIEFNDFNQLKLINLLGNQYKHQALIPFTIDEFIKCIRVVFILARKVYNYYNKQLINQIKPLNEAYYHDLIHEEQTKHEEVLMYRTQVDFLRNALIEKEDELEKLQKQLNTLENKLKQLTSAEKELNVLQRENHNLKEKLETSRNEHKELKKDWQAVNQEIQKIMKEYNELKQFKKAAQELLSKIFKEKTFRPFSNFETQNLIDNWKTNK